MVIQELGMHSGNTVLNSSEEIQRIFFETFFQEMNKNEQINVAYVFQLVDWSPELTDLYIKIFEDEGLPQDYIDAFSESLETIGLIQYSDGKSKPAWTEFTYWLNEFE
jgi:hypothetical protein